MKKYMYYIFLGISSLLPILFLTASAKDALFAGLCVFCGIVLMYGVSLIKKSVLPENVTGIVNIIACSAGVSIVYLLSRKIAFLDGGNTYVPLCTVSALILYIGIEKISAPLTRGIYTASLGVALTVGSTLLGIVRELLGKGEFFGLTVFSEKISPFAAFTVPAGAIFIFAIIYATARHFGQEENQ